jgi:hypothetical protein
MDLWAIPQALATAEAPKLNKKARRPFSIPFFATEISS